MGHSDRCWIAIVMDFDVYWAALPTGGWHRLLADCKCKERVPWNTRQCKVTKARNHDKGRGERTVTNVHRAVTGIQNKTVTVGAWKQVVTEV